MNFDSIVGAIKELAKEALKGLRDPILRTFIFVATALSLLALGGSILLSQSGQATFSFILLILAVVILALMFLVLVAKARGSERLKLEEDRRKANAAASWSRAVPIFPIVEAINDMSELLEHIRLNAFKYLNAFKPELKDDQIRASIFVADYNKPKEGIVFELVMHDVLRKNMKRPQEWNLRFNPGQGATGKVFIEGGQRVTERRPDSSGTWDSIFEMTDDLKQKVHPNLKWIFSMPLKDPKNLSTLAVLNIDVLVQEFDEEQLGAMGTSIFKDTVGLSNLMAKNSKVNVSIHIEKEKV